MPGKLSDAAKMMGQRGGRTRAKNLSAGERQEIARRAARARWAKAKRAVKPGRS